MRRNESYWNFEILKEFCFKTINSFSIFNPNFKNSFITKILFWDRSFFSLRNRTPLWGNLFLKMRFPKSLSLVKMIRKSRFAIPRISLSEIPLISSYTEITSCPNVFKKLATFEPVHSSTMIFIEKSSRESRGFLQIDEMNRISNTCLNVFFRKISIFTQNLIKSSTIGNQIQYKRYRKTGSFNHRFSTQYFRIAMNSNLPIVYKTFHSFTIARAIFPVNSYFKPNLSQGANP